MARRRRRRSKYSKSLVKQMHERMQSMARMGQSKHKAKKQFRAELEAKGEKANPAEAPGMFSKATYTNYKQVSSQFISWLRETHPQIRHIDDIPKTVFVDYLHYRRNQGLSPYTLSKDMSGINKLFNTNFTKKELDLPTRSYKNITRSRVERKHDKKYNPENYRQQIDVSKAFGMRRESIIHGDYQIKEGSIYKHNGKLYAAVIEKGGKFRNAPCLKAMQTTIEKHFPNIPERDTKFTKNEYQEIYSKLGNQYLFDKYTDKIDNHAFRREYTFNLYNEIEKGYADVRNGYRGYDKRILRGVSQALGHNRISVVVEHYLR